MKKVLLTGANGMLGQDFIPVLKKHGYEVIPADRREFDITDKSSILDFTTPLNIDLIIHCAAYTNVDKAEEDTENAFLVNATGSENLASIAAKLDVPIVYISTDYVFDGEKTSPYQTTDATNPQNIYGLSKLKGEIAVKQATDKHYIVRTSWLYGHKGKNFVETMLDLASKMPALKVVDDQQGCPTWTMALIDGIINILDSKSFGTYHVCGSGNTTWYGFAKKIFEISGVNIEVQPVTTDAFPRPAKRPAYSIMDNAGICPDWEESLEQYLKLRKGN